MAAPQQSSGGQSGDNTSGVLWVVAGIFIGLGVLWYALKKYIIYFYLTMKLYEVNFLIFLTEHLHFKEHYFDQLQADILTARLNNALVTFSQLVHLGNAAGDWFRIPLVVIMVVLAFLVYFGNATRVYKRTYSMKELAELEKDNWPQITPVIGLDLVNTDIDKGPWAMAMTPMQFCKRNALLEEVRPQRREGMSRKEWDRIEVILKRGEANKIFALQLGPLWKGSHKLPPHTRALFAAFAARINADSEPAAKILSQLSASCKTKLNMAGVNELLKKHENTKLVQQIVQSHAYVLTIMASMLEAAREDGVQGSADFLWLKPVDRRLWYTLNTVGRQTPFIEVAGIFAHWLAEKEAARKLLVPVVEEATNATELALKEILYRPDEES